MTKETDTQNISLPETEAPEDTTANAEEPAVIGTTITKAELEEYKKKYKKMYQSLYNNKIYVWHRLSRADFTQICDDTQEIEDESEMLAERERGFCKACIVYPPMEEVIEDIDYEVIREKLAQEIIYRSGFYPPVTQEL